MPTVGQPRWSAVLTLGVALGAVTGLLAVVGTKAAHIIGYEVLRASSAQGPFSDGPVIVPLFIVLEVLSIVPMGLVLVAIRTFVPRLGLAGGALYGLIVASVPARVDATLGPYFLYVQETIGPKGPYPPGVIEWSGVGPPVAQQVFVVIFVVAGLVAAAVSPAIERILRRPRSERWSVAVNAAAFGLFAIGLRLLFLHLVPAS